MLTQYAHSSTRTPLNLCVIALHKNYSLQNINYSL